MKATADNVFVGAKVSYKGEEHTVVKVNAKSVYVAKDSNFLKRWEERPKGVKWKDFCERNDAFQTKYDEIEISKEESSKKQEAEKKQEIKKQKKQIIGKDVEKQLVDAMKKGLKGKNYKFPIEGSSERISIVEMNKEKKIALFHELSGDLWAFYDMEKDIYLPFKKKEHKNGKEIVWPNYEPAA